MLFHSIRSEQGFWVAAPLRLSGVVTQTISSDGEMLDMIENCFFKHSTTVEQLIQFKLFIANLMLIKLTLIKA